MTFLKFNKLFLSQVKVWKINNYQFFKEILNRNIYKRSTKNQSLEGAFVTMTMHINFFIFILIFNLLASGKALLREFFSWKRCQCRLQLQRWRKLQTFVATILHSQLKHVLSPKKLGWGEVGGSKCFEISTADLWKCRGLTKTISNAVCWPN